MSLFRKRSKSESHQEYQCTIRFLDDSEPIQSPFVKDTLGQLVLDKVCGTLNLMEKDYFGLRYVDAEKQRHWLDPTKTIYRQLKGGSHDVTLPQSSPPTSPSANEPAGVSPCVLCFRVKFYPADPMKLHEEITRYYLFLQLRRDLHHGRLLCSPQDANLLAAYIIQSEVGDYDPQDHPPGYVAEFKMLPKQNIKMEEQIMDLHKTLAGQVPAEAEANFLKKASTLDTYGVDPHQVKDQKGTQLYLGVTHQGIMTFHGNRRTQMYKWSQIKKLAFEGKMFIAHVNINEDEDNTKKKHQPVGYKCINAAACKYLWKCAVEQQYFFTLADSYNPPKLRSGGSLFSRGSKFRFSGRCQNEAYQASESIKRKEPDFQRTCSLPTFARHMGNKSFDEKARSINKTMPGVREDLSRKPYKEPSKATDASAVNVDVKPSSSTKEGEDKAEVRVEPPIQSQKLTEVQSQPVKPAREGIKAGRPEVSENAQFVPVVVVERKETSVDDIPMVVPQAVVERKETAVDDIPMVTRQSENAVDVPGTAELPQSPVIKAPGPKGDDPFTEMIQAAQVSPVSSGNPAMLRQNGTIPIIVTPAVDSPCDDVTLPYNPEESMYDDDEDAKAAKSLEDQVLEIEKEYEETLRMREDERFEQNHVSPVTEDMVQPVDSKKAESLPNHTSQPTTTKTTKPSPDKSSSKCSCFKMLAFTFFFVGLTLAAMACFVMFSDYKHPVMDQVREQVPFLDPVRDYIQHQYKSIFQKS